MPWASAATLPVQQQTYWESQGWLSELKALPKLREIPWKTGTQPASANHRSENAAASILATRGKIAQRACVTCLRGKGHFSFCISLEGWFGGSCANCHYGARGKRCSLRDIHNGGSKTRTPPKRNADTLAAQKDVGHDGSEGDDHEPRKRQRRSSRYEEAMKQLANAPQSPSPSPSPEYPTNVVVSDIAGRHRGNLAPTSAAELKDVSNSRPPPSAFRARRGKSSSGMRSYLGSSSRHETCGMGRTNINTNSGNIFVPQPPITITPSSSRVDPRRSIINGHSDAARQNGQAKTPVISQNGLLSSGISHSEPSFGKQPPVAIIDTLSKAQQKQMYAVLSGIEGGMAHLQKQFKTLRNILGVDTEDE